MATTGQDAEEDAAEAEEDAAEKRAVLEEKVVRLSPDRRVLL